MSATCFRRLIASLLSVISLLALWPAEANAWGRDGHRIVARIATRHLTQKTKDAISALLLSDQEDPSNCKSKTSLEEKLACVSTFADEVRSKYPKTALLHFVNVPVYLPAAQRNYQPVRDCSKGCVVSGIALYRKKLLTSHNDAERAEALKFIVHFIGDLHQPLHTVKDKDLDFNNIENKTAGHQRLHSDGTGDRGANFKLVTWFGEGSSDFGCRNLHSVWDGGIIKQRGLGEGDFTNYLDKVSAADMAAFQKGDVVSWVNQGVKLAVSNAYGLLPERDANDKVCEVDRMEDDKKKTDCVTYDPERCRNSKVHYRYALGESYYEPNLPVVESQLQKAGLRLARFLNNVFDPAL